ncbi:MAG: YcgN family cysteine cluster protein [Gammaproteobacteria bacterium]|nr:YcgN family cysteine cluster protein [Gammaproteobacteria bacterium]
MDKPFWEQPIQSLNREEWEQICDGCGRCCLIQLEDEEDQERYTTAVCCRYYDLDLGRCSVYPNRSEKVPTCHSLTPDTIEQLSWMPPSCSYRRLASGQPLAPWHPLLSGDPDSVVHAGISIRHFAIPEQMLGEDVELEEYIISSTAEESQRGCH